MILEITDTHAATPLTSYRRQIIQVAGSSGLLIDLGSNSGGELQAGYLNMSVGGADNQTRSQSFTGDFFGTGDTTVGVALSSVDNRDRGNPTGSPLNGLLADAYKEASDITMILSGLAPGEYEIATYHYDVLDGGDATIDIYVDGELKASNIEISNNITDPKGIATYRFTATGSDVVFLFDRQGGGEVYLNGFDLFLVPEPASAALLGLGGLALLPRRRRNQ